MPAVKNEKSPGLIGLALLGVGGLLGFGIYLVSRINRAPSGPVPVSIALADLIATGQLMIVTALNPDTGLFEAFVPGLPGNTLTVIRPNSIISITMTATRTIISSGVQYLLPADTPTQVTIGSTVSITVLPL